MFSVSPLVNIKFFTVSDCKENLFMKFFQSWSFPVLIHIHRVLPRQIATDLVSNSPDTYS